MAKIKPCPFCGQPAHVKQIDYSFRVVCDTPVCASRYRYLTKEMAIKEWNTRIKPKKEDSDGQRT